MFPFLTQTNEISQDNFYSKEMAGTASTTKEEETANSKTVSEMKSDKAATEKVFLHLWSD